jgi:hypothetical protein
VITIICREGKFLDLVCHLKSPREKTTGIGNFRSVCHLHTLPVVLVIQLCNLKFLKPTDVWVIVLDFWVQIWCHVGMFECLKAEFRFDNMNLDVKNWLEIWGSIDMFECLKA